MIKDKEITKLTKEWAAKRLPERSEVANKGTFGKVLVIAGSENYPGAAYLACAAAYRAGVGLVTLVTEQSAKIIVSRKLPEVTFLSRKQVFKKINDYDVILLGSGLGQSNQATKLVESFCINYSQYKNKTVIDGDGLNVLSKIDKWWKQLNGEVVLTPHPGEMARLTGLSIDQIQKDRLNIAQKYAEKWKQTVVLKGANTVIASPAGELILSSFANPLLATAGTGDILAGMIAGMLAQGLEPFDASCIGVYLHGLAGELLKEKIGDAGMLAGDLLPFIPLAIKKIKLNN
ncbi:NAD(P)H-hydrate dehydratase [Candidatus Daviesbacteria bacterium]|nr:NAD(P)H-hydrate dehydratase [Candidatus Daviesbacteria bacterium]